MHKKLYYPMRSFFKDKWEQRNSFFFIKLLLSCLAWYTAIYWVADSRYNRELARLEARVTNIITRLEGNNWRKAIEDIPTLQRTLVPHEPLFFDIISVYKSLNPIYDTYDEQIVKELSKMLIAHKEELNDLQLSSAIMNTSINKKHTLYDCDFTNSNFTGADLRNITFINANLNLTWFMSSNMSSSRYMFANLNYANFSNAEMNDSYFSEVKLNDTDFRNANLKNSYIVGIDFSQSINLSTANLESTMYNSKEITEHGTEHDYRLLERYRTQYCQHQKLDQCFSVKYTTSPNPKTLFPVDFDPKAHGMIDLSDFLDYIKIQEGNSK